MESKKNDISVVFLLLIPVLVAITGLLSEFNILDFSYLFFVSIIFGRYYYRTRKNH